MQRMKNMMYAIPTLVLVVQQGSSVNVGGSGSGITIKLDISNQNSAEFSIVTTSTTLAPLRLLERGFSSRMPGEIEIQRSLIGALML